MDETFDPFENYRQERLNRDGNSGRMPQDWYGEDYK